MVEDGRVIGAELAGGAHVTAPIVVSNADPFKTFGPMLGDDAPVGYLRRMHRMRPSISGYLLFGATGLDVERAGHVNFHYDSWDIEDAYRRTLAGEAAALTISVPTLVDPTLAPEGEHVLVAAAPMRYETDADWGAVKASMTPRIVERLDALAPGLGGSLTFSEPATPLTLERFSGNQGGAMYGWDYAADHKSSLRPDTVTPVNGLYLAGQWTSLGGGFVRSALSGTIAAERILARRRRTAPLHERRPGHRGVMTSRKDTMDSSDRLRLVSRFFDEVWNDGDFSFIDDNYAPGFTLHALWQNTALGGSGEAAKETAKTVIGAWRDALPDLFMTVEEAFVDGDMVVMRHRCGGTQEGELMGIAPTGLFGEITGVTMTRVADDGLITDAWTCWDALYMLQQLGVVPGRAAVPERRREVRRRRARGRRRRALSSGCTRSCGTARVSRTSSSPPTASPTLRGPRSCTARTGWTRSSVSGAPRSRTA